MIATDKYRTAPKYPHTLSRVYMSGSQKDSLELDFLDYDISNFHHTLSGMHLSGSQKELWAVDLLNYNTMLSEEIQNRYLNNSCLSNNVHRQGTYTISINIWGSFVTNTCTTLRNKPVYYGGGEVEIIETGNYAVGEQVSQNFIDTSADIIKIAHSLFEGSKPLEGRALEVLKKTLKKSFKQTPTRL